MSNFSDAKKLFYDNANYNASLASAHSKVKYKGILWGGKQVTPAEVLESLKELGLEITQRTLQRYENSGLIPIPKRGSGGRGKGKFTDYAPETVWEAYVAHYFMHNKIFDWSSEKVAAIRNISLNGVKKDKLSGQSSRIPGIMDYEIFIWRLYALYTKYKLPVAHAQFEGGLHSLFEAIKNKDSEAIRQAYIARACDYSDYNCNCCGFSIWNDHVEKKFNLPDGWKEEENELEYVYNEPCPREEECFRNVKNTWIRDCLVFHDEDDALWFGVYERKPGTEEWILVAEDKF